MNLRHLRYFEAVARAGSFRKASLELHIAQPALTRQITALEEELGVTLFEPGSRRRVLSAAGKVLLNEAHAIQDSVERGVRKVRAAGQGRRSRLRIAFTDIASGDAMLAGFVNRLRRAMPATEIQLLPMGSMQQAQALLKGSIDAGCLCCLPRMNSRIALRPMTDHAMLAVLRRTHPLARRKKLFLRDLEKAHLIFVSKAVRPDLRRLVIDAFRKAGLVAPSFEEVEGSAQITSMVSVGRGVGLLMSAFESRLPDGLVSRPVEGLDIHYQLAIAWCADSKNPAVAELASVARDRKLFPKRAASLSKP